MMVEIHAILQNVTKKSKPVHFNTDWVPFSKPVLWKDLLIKKSPRFIVLSDLTGLQKKFLICPLAVRCFLSQVRYK